MAFAVTAQHDNSRAAFLSGLRTGGPRSVSPMPPADGNRSPQHYGQSPDSLGRMKANAAVFTPSGPQTPPGGYNGYSEQKLDGLEEQLAAMRMHALAAQKQSNLSKYGMSQAQPHYQDERATAMARQQQQEQQQLQIQMTMMQLQAQHQQQQQQQHIAVQQQQHQQQQQQQQQQIMLAKLHAEYERLNNSSSPDNDALHHILGEQQHASAQEQRQAAQASIQNSLRYRQAQAQQQLYQSMLDGQQTAKQQQQRIDAQALLFQQQQQHQQQQQQFQQQLLYAQLQAQAQAASMTPPVPLEQRSWRSSASHSRTQTPPSVRSGSPAAQAQATNASSNGHKKAADSASSWRKTKTPSIVVDDSASDTQGSVSDNETPQTSEENAPSSSFKTEQANTARMHSLPQRAVPVSAAPRTRAFADQGSRVASDSAPGSQTTIHPQRQPHGPPTDVRPTNFSARLSQRTRREALSKLNALVRSPRTVAAFSGIAA